MKTLLIMAGGTGGHVIPALQIGKDLRARGVRIIWLGTKGGIENSLVPAADFELHTISAKGLRGNSIMRQFSALFMLIKATLQAAKIIYSSKADALLGMGGFAAGPGGAVAWLMRKPLIIHEQNARIGTTNKILACLATRKLSGLGKPFSSAAQATGNPVNKALGKIAVPSKRLSARTGPLRLLVVGGSLGAQVFNESLPDLCKQLSASTPLTIRHQSGRHRRQSPEAPNRGLEVQHAYEAAGLESTVVEFIDDMAAAYEWADFVICRSGAMTVSEVAAAGVAALFVPYPHAIDDHQWFNAQQLAADGSALCYRQAAFIEGGWIPELAAYGADRAKIIALAEQAHQHARLNATTEVADVCMQLLSDL